MTLAVMKMGENLSYPPLRVPPPQTPRDPQTPLRSPMRRPQVFPDESDPLLGNLSPESILDALAAINAVSKHEKQAKDLLVKTISQVSNEERALGARAAIAAQKLRGWLKEVQGWQWPVGRDAQLGKGFVPSSASQADTSQPSHTTSSEAAESGTEYLGSLPAEVVARYETRIEEIRDGMDSLDVEELKEHVLNVHIPMRSRPSSSNSAISVAPPPLSYVQLSDFNAVITATIMRALPTLSRLNILLNTWDARLLVLRQIPGLLMSLKSARAALDSSRSSLKDQSEESDLFSLDTFHSKKDELEKMVVEAGRRMDRILDVLEGRPDSLPEAWIDDLETIEADFATWVVEAEKRAVENELKRLQAQEQQRKKDASLSPVDKTDQNKESNKLTGNPQNERENGDKPIELVTEEEASPSSEKVVLDSETNDTTPSPDNDARVVSESPASTVSAEEDAESSSLDTPGNNEIPPSRVEITPQPEPPSIASNTSQEGDDTLVQTIPSFNALDKAVSVSDPATDTKGSSSVEATCRDALDGAADSGSESSALESGKEVTEASHIPDGDSDKLPPKTENDPHQVPTDEKTMESSETEPHSEVPENNQAAPSRCEDLSETLNNETSISEQPPDNSVCAGHEREGLDSPAEIAASAPNSTIVLSTELPENQEKAENKPVRGEETAELAIDNRLSESPINPPLSHTLQTDGLEPTRSDQGPVAPEDPDDSALKAKEFVGQTPRTPEHASKSRPVIHHSLPGEQPTGPHGPADDASPERDAELDKFNESPSIDAPTPGLTSNGSPGLTSTDSERTMREGPSPRLDHELLPNRRSFRHTKAASLPLQRFINEGIHTNYELNDGFQADDYSTPRASDASVGMLENNEQRVMPAHKKSPTPSPPLDVKPQPAIRPGRPGLVRGASSTQIEPSPTLRKGHTKTKSNTALSDIVNSRSSRQKLAPSTDVGPGSSSKTAGPLGRSVAVRLAGDLRSQPSMDSIGSFNSNSEAGDAQSSFSMDDESFAMMKPFSETDEQLQEKINSILTSIPARIRLSSTPAYDSDQRSTISSISASKRERLGSRSPFSTPSRSSTPTPSLTLAPAASRPRRTHAHTNEEKTVRVYHLHQPGKTAPTKLFVRSVGEDGERVMVRVGGGWADLGEYLREYVHHHGRRAVSSSRVEVQDLPTQGSPAMSSPGSTLTPSTDNGRSTPLSRPASVMSNRPSSSLSVHKRRPSKAASDIGELTNEHTPSESDPSSRRLSVASMNSVSFSVAGDGANGHSPYTGSSRHSTPLGLAGPTPRSRRMSMSPESEAWVEGVIGQARRTSSSAKTQKHGESRMDREFTGIRTLRDPNPRSASDIGTGLNKRVLLRGLGGKLDHE
ncbi:hypothetical protein VTN96DRAFT_4741 [Rasamsonia emersonii]